MRSGMNKLGSVLQALTEALDLGQGLQAQRAVQVFAAVVGEQISAHAWAEGVRGDTLLVVTDSPVWSHQLQMLEPELVGKLKATLGADCPVTKLRFRSGSRRRAWDRPGEDAAQSPGEGGVSKNPRRRLSRQDWVEIRLAAGQAQDSELARALAGALRAQIAPGEDAGGRPPGGGESSEGTPELPR